MNQEILNGNYSWESVIDIAEDVEYALAQAKLDGEFRGSISVRVEYIPDEE